MRGLAYNRKKSFAKAKRKQNICKHIYGWEYYDHLHQYSKNKIHCSCGMCSPKTNQHRQEHGSGVGARAIYTTTDENNKKQIMYETLTWGTSHSGKRKNWKFSDLRKIEKLEWDEKNWYKEDDFIIPREDTFEDWWILFNIRLEEMRISGEEK